MAQHSASDYSVKKFRLNLKLFFILSKDGKNYTQSFNEVIRTDVCSDDSVDDYKVVIKGWRKLGQSGLYAVEFRYKKFFYHNPQCTPAAVASRYGLSNKRVGSVEKDYKKVKVDTYGQINNAVESQLLTIRGVFNKYQSPGPWQIPDEPSWYADRWEFDGDDLIFWYPSCSTEVDGSSIIFIESVYSGTHSIPIFKSVYDEVSVSNTPTRVIYPTYTLPASNSKYFYYNGNTPDGAPSVGPSTIASIGAWGYSDPGSPSGWINGLPGTEITIRQDTTVVPLYYYKFKVNYKGDLPGNPNFKKYTYNTESGTYNTSSYLVLNDGSLNAAEYYRTPSTKSNRGVGVGHEFTLSIPEIGGYKFSGWKFSTGKIYPRYFFEEVVTPWNYLEHRQLEAVWSPGENQITYKAYIKLSDGNYKEVNFVNKDTKKIVYLDPQSFKTNANAYLFNFSKIADIIEGYEELASDKQKWVVMEADGNWVKGAEFDFGKQISTKDDPDNSYYGNATLGVILTPKTYNIYRANPHYVEEKEGSTHVWKLMGVQHSGPKQIGTYTVLDTLDLHKDPYLDDDIDSNEYRISRGYKWLTNIVAKTNSELYPDRGIITRDTSTSNSAEALKPYKNFGDLYVYPRYDRAKYQFIYEAFGSSDWRVSDEFEYYSPYKSGYPSDPDAKLIKPEGYNFNGWVDSKDTLVYINDLTDLKANTNNTDYFLPKIYLAGSNDLVGQEGYLVPKAKWEKGPDGKWRTTQIALKLDTSRIFGLRVNGQNEWKFPRNLGYKTIGELVLPDTDFIKVYDPKDDNLPKWRQVNEIYIYTDTGGNTMAWKKVTLTSPEAPLDVELI